MPSQPTGAPAAEERVERLSRMRRTIGEHMRRSLDTAAHVTAVFEVDFGAVETARARLKPRYAQEHGVNLTLLPFVARATLDALADWPWMNAELRDGEVVVRSHVNLGIAVALDGGRGLVVPVIRDAHALDLLGLARAIADRSQRARAGELRPSDLEGGTFTITNPGAYGALLATPIINQPQVAVLDMEALIRRPVVVTDEHGEEAIAVRPVMNLCISYDHRLIDGVYGAAFMAQVKRGLEHWPQPA
ncbi:MAG TPA: 2-oxo acid dehydrogenase subunit E2 [Capillimicrobium sp.]|nr:2-oxo acid dehydrogenase subunit E2 [Capillimicrobium sp.]